MVFMVHPEETSSNISIICATIFVYGSRRRSIITNRRSNISSSSSCNSITYNIFPFNSLYVRAPSSLNSWMNGPPVVAVAMFPSFPFYFTPNQTQDDIKHDYYSM